MSSEAKNKQLEGGSIVTPVPPLPVELQGHSGQATPYTVLKTNTSGTMDLFQVTK